jgi:hypothetical protein
MSRGGRLASDTLTQALIAMAAKAFAAPSRDST